MVKCYRCDDKGTTKQHIPPKSCSSPDDRRLVRLCPYCHNLGVDPATTIERDLINNIDNEPSTKVVTVNGSPAIAHLGSIAPNTMLPEPSQTFSEIFVNKNTNSQNDFRMIRDDSNLMPSGANFGREWCSYVILVKADS